ncbi:hypothetical protein LUZ63_014672 [Rhynchospora breviuscula]|uniref:Expp1 protein n=1 Tax=Rhynchospora breviuscula TaxID=2022672 RepID=A0A9Q0CB33_9POAL|nr:hypothetical protein LUZ63_014672 [Rhynchospora breviuscula]
MVVHDDSSLVPTPPHQPLFSFPLSLSFPQSEKQKTNKHKKEKKKFLVGAMRQLVELLLLLLATASAVSAADENRVFEPCSDTKIQRGDGFSFGLAFSSHDSFYSDKTQLSPCDRRLSLGASSAAQLAVFRPKVDEISLLTVNTTTGFDPVSAGGYMVAFAGRRFAARSPPIFVASSSYTVSSFTLVLEFKKGRLQNLFWKNNDGCARCTGKTNFVCLNKQTCAIRTNNCKNQGSVDCSIGIQLAFSGTDKHESVLNSWYEVSNLQQYSLYGLYSNLRGSLTSQYSKFF